MIKDSESSWLAKFGLLQHDLSQFNSLCINELFFPRHLINQTDQRVKQVLHVFFLMRILFGITFSVLTEKLEDEINTFKTNEFLSVLGGGLQQNG